MASLPLPLVTDLGSVKVLLDDKDMDIEAELNAWFIQGLKFASTEYNLYLGEKY